jgi:hypothetical protein
MFNASPRVVRAVHKSAFTKIGRHHNTTSVEERTHVDRNFFITKIQDKPSYFNFQNSLSFSRGGTFLNTEPS